MRMLMQAKMPNDKFNTLISSGKVEASLTRVLEATKPEAAYFTAIDGQRTAVLIIELADVSDIPKFAEPWFLTFGAEIDFKPVMTPSDLGKAGLDALAKAWT